MSRTFDVVVIGAGPVGENVAARAVRGGLSAALVEEELVGGECSYWACMPSKALLRPGLALSAARRVAGSREAVTGDLDVAAVLARRDSFTSHWKDKGQVEWAEGAGITVVRGRGRLSGEKEVTVGDEVLAARHAVVLCTGSVPTSPPLDGLDTVRTWSSRDATSAQQVPRRLGVLGGGVVGCEMAQAWARLGSEVTLFARERLLERLEPVAGELVADGLREDGVTVVLDDSPTSVAPYEGGIRITTGRSTYDVDEFLVATGRRAATSDLGLATVGIDDGARLSVDEQGVVQEGGHDWLYAAGDVAGRAQLTHQGKYEARIVGDVIAARAAGTPGSDRPEPWSPWSITADSGAVPSVVFTDPEVASVGLTSHAAQEAGYDVRTVDLPLAVAGSSLQADDYTGHAVMVVDEARRVLLGVTFVGQDVAELVHSATVAIVGEVPLDRLWHAVPSYPTISEVWLRLLESYGL